MKYKTIKISSEYSDIGKRLDIFLSEKLQKFTRSQIKKIINQNLVMINNNSTKSQSKKIKKNDLIYISLEKSINDKLLPSKKKVEIVHEDKDIIVINKPQGMVVHPGAGNKKDTLVNILIGSHKKKLSKIGDPTRPGIVHRIDKETSGLLVVAKNNLAHAFLGKQFSNHSIRRKYLALVWGVLRPLKGKIETFITRSKKNRQLMIADEFKGKKAITKYHTVKVYSKIDVPKLSLIEFELETGRTHQIRVHMKYKGTSILGDNKYKKKNLKFKKLNKKFEILLNSLKGQVLHASTLGFIHPKNSKIMEFKSDLPAKFKKLLFFLDKLDN